MTVKKYNEMNPRLKSLSEFMDEQIGELDAAIRAGKPPEGMSRKNVRYWKRYMKKRAKIKKKES